MNEIMKKNKTLKKIIVRNVSTVWNSDLGDVFFFLLLEQEKTKREKVKMKRKNRGNS